MAGSEKKRKGFLLRVVVFAVLACAMLAKINEINEPEFYMANSDWPTTSTYKEFYQMKKNSVDVLILGSSVAVNSYNTQELYDAYGIRSYNLASEQQSLLLSYYWLKEALRFQSPKAVVLDMHFLVQHHFDYTDNPIMTSEGLTRKCMDPMKFSAVKLEAVQDIVSRDTDQSFLSYFLTNIRFHARWKDLNETDFHPEYVSEKRLKGWGPYYKPMEQKDLDRFTPLVSEDPDAMIEPDQVAVEYLDKIRELCDEKGIELILFDVPEVDMNEGRHNFMTNYAARYGLDYYDMKEEKYWEQIGAKLPYENAVFHANVSGSVLITRFVGRLLKDVYHIPSVQDSQWEDSEPFYQHVLNNQNIVDCMDLHEYLSLVKDPSYTVFFSVCGDSAGFMNPQIQKDLSDLGMPAPSGDKNSWYAVKNAEGNISEELYGLPVSRTGTLRHGTVLYSISSKGLSAGVGNAEIILDDEDYALNETGLNVVVYDNNIMKVIDSAVFTVQDGKSTVFR